MDEITKVLSLQRGEIRGCASKNAPSCVIRKISLKTLNVLGNGIDLVACNVCPSFFVVFFETRTASSRRHVDPALSFSRKQATRIHSYLLRQSNQTMKSTTTLVLGLLFLSAQTARCFSSSAFRPLQEGSVPPSSSSGDKATTKIASYQQAVCIIDAAAVSRVATPDLYPAVLFLQDHAAELYATDKAQQLLWQKAHGSFELVLSTGKTQDFHPPPRFLPFSYAMINEQHFGNGVGWDANHIWISMLQKHYYNPVQRQMVVMLRDIYLGGQRVTHRVPAWIRDQLHVGKLPHDFVNQAPPTFTLVGASDTCLVASGNQSGGFAIWTRLPKDMCPVVAYQGYHSSSSNNKGDDNSNKEDSAP